MKHFGMFSVSLFVLLAGCTSSGSDAGEADTVTRGHAVYRDAQTDHAGQPKAAAAPAPQPEDEPMLIELEVEGTANAEGVDPACGLDGASGAFEGFYFGEATIDDDGAYVVSMASAEALFETPSGCEISELEIAAVGEVTVRAALAATTPNCEGYCAAKARAAAESECGANASAASCRGAAETSYEASCTASCTASDRYVIVAETTLSADAIAALNARSLTGGALGELTLDLELDHIEDGERETVDE